MADPYEFQIPFPVFLPLLGAALLNIKQQGRTSCFAEKKKLGLG